MSINAYQHTVIEVAKVASPVGSHGPALINLHWPNTWPGSYWGKGSWDGNSGLLRNRNAIIYYNECEICGTRVLSIDRWSILYTIKV